MSQKQINHIIEYTNKVSKNQDNMNIRETHNINNNYTLKYDDDEYNNYKKIYNIAIDTINSRNSYYLKNICLDK
jgi:hypothetical protein